MAAYISVPRDLTKVKSKVAFNLTARQLICFGAAATVGVPLFFVLRDTAGNSGATLGMMAVMLNQANGDRQILAKQLNISPHQLSYVTHSGSGEGLLFYGNTILPFVDHFPHDLELYKIMTTKLSEVTEAEKHE